MVTKWWDLKVGGDVVIRIHCNGGKRGRICPPTEITNEKATIRNETSLCNETYNRIWEFGIFFFVLLYHWTAQKWWAIKFERGEMAQTKTYEMIKYSFISTAPWCQILNSTSTDRYLQYSTMNPFPYPHPPTFPPHHTPPTLRYPSPRVRHAMGFLTNCPNKYRGSSRDFNSRELRALKTCARAEKPDDTNPKFI